VRSGSGAASMTVAHSSGRHSRLAFGSVSCARSMPLAGLLGIFPRLTAWANIEDSAVVILSANDGHCVPGAAVAHLVERRLGDS
jgi:hypothetical protein